MGLGHSARTAGGQPPAAPRGAAARQRIEIGSEWVTIRRDICGIEARVNVPTHSYRGVTLRKAGGLYELALSHMDASLEVVITRTGDDSDLIALWRDYARMLDLPLLAEDGRGRLLPMEAWPSEHPFARRRGSPLKNRRTRFQANRAMGASPAG
jgi:hypothetical protein